MVTLDKAVVARMKRDGHCFEVLVDPELALRLKAGENVSMTDLLAVDDIWKDSQKGLKCSEDLMRQVFKTSDKVVVAKTIVLKGEVQVPTEIRKKQTEQRKRQIANMISRSSIDPSTKTPHPPERILRAMNESGVRIDLRPAAEQMEEVIKEIREKIPLSFERSKVAVRIPALYAGPAYGVIKQFNPKKEQWLNNGDFLCELELTAASKLDFYDRLNALTHGEVEVKELK